jgi:sarcosine oxidase subunit alpha
MWPNWHWFEPLIRAAAGLGHAAPADAGTDADRYDEVSRQVDVLVVGGGAAGMAAALAAAAAGKDVLLVEGSKALGGWALGTSDVTFRNVQAQREQLDKSSIAVLTRCTVLGLYDHRLTVAVEHVRGAVRERLWKIRARRIILATGAFERPMLFPDNDRPGVMLASASGCKPAIAAGVMASTAELLRLAAVDGVMAWAATICVTAAACCALRSG